MILDEHDDKGDIPILVMILHKHDDMGRESDDTTKLR